MAAPAGVSVGILIVVIFIFAAVVTLAVLVDEDLKDRKGKQSLTVGGPTEYDPPVPWPPYIAWPAQRPAPYVIPSDPNHPRVAAMLGVVGGEGFQAGGGCGKSCC